MSAFRKYGLPFLPALVAAAGLAAAREALDWGGSSFYVAAVIFCVLVAMLAAMIHGRVGLSH